MTSERASKENKTQTPARSKPDAANGPVDESPLPVLDLNPQNILRLQRTIGNSAVQRLLQQRWSGAPESRSVLHNTIQRDDDAATAEATATAITVDNWPSTLPRAVRVTDKKDPSKDTNIKVKLGQKVKKTDDTEVGPYDEVVTEKAKTPKGKDQDYVIQAPTMENAEKGFSGTLTDDQQKFVESIQQARDGLDISKLHLNKYGSGIGWQYGGAPKADATPTDVQGTADTSTPQGKRKQAEQWIWEELRFEGSSASINAYDTQMVTWGRGLGAATGGLNTAMNDLFKDPEIAAAFKEVGVSFENNTWLAINTLTGAVEEGRNALAIMQTDPHILAAMIAIGENPNFKQKVGDAQWKGIKAIGTAKVPDYALDWPKEIIQWVAHITHWGPAYGWHSASAGYEASKGDATAILLHFFKTAAGKPNKNGSYSIRAMGPDVIRNFGHWGGGIGLRTLTSTFKEATLINDDIIGNEKYRGYYILKKGEPDKGGNMPCYVYDAR
jgi:hypothetical protein